MSRSWEIEGQPSINETGEYKELAEAVVLQSNTGKAVKYPMPAGRDTELVRMGIKPMVQKAGFETVHIRQKKDNKGAKVEGVYLIWATKDPTVPTATPLLLPAPAVPAQ